ncbi:MAG: bifunctional folylpolyglutamate synthase/dihydrofolate synthase [Candidatus Xenobia bacterium]
MTFPEAIRELEELAVRPLKRGRGMNPARLRYLLSRLEGAARPLPPVVHVVGTCGKGSTSAMAASILQAAGYRTGLFTGPHLVDYRERIGVDGEWIGAEPFVQAWLRVRPPAMALECEVPTLGRPSVLEVLTAMAIDHFRRRQVQAIVLEAGLGGARDATMAVPASVTVLTHIGLDHMATLGPDVPSIAREKAGALRPGVPAVLAAQDPAARAVVEEVAKRRGAPLLRVPQDLEAVDVQTALSEVRFSVQGRRTLPDLRIPMGGRHQVNNALAAILGVDSLRVPDAAIRDGLAAARMPARLQVLSGHPMVILDGAHNQDAARALAETLRETPPPRPMTLLIGILADKAREPMLHMLLPLADRVVATRPPWDDRGGDFEAWGHMVRDQRPDAELIEDVATAFDASCAGAASVVVAGSLYLAGAVAARLRSREEMANGVSN